MILYVARASAARKEVENKNFSALYVGWNGVGREARILVRPKGPFRKGWKWGVNRRKLCFRKKKRAGREVERIISVG